MKPKQLIDCEKRPAATVKKYIGDPMRNAFFVSDGFEYKVEEFKPKSNDLRRYNVYKNGNFHKHFMYLHSAEKFASGHDVVLEWEDSSVK